MLKDNTVYIGRKPVMNYVLAVLSLVNQEESNQVVLRARGRAISLAVEVAEVTRNRYVPDLTCSVSIGTEEMPREGGGTRNLSTMEIILKDSTGEDEKAELQSLEETPKPLDPLGEPDEPAKVEDPSLEETSTSPSDKKIMSDLTQNDEAPEAEKALTKSVPK